MIVRTAFLILFSTVSILFSGCSSQKDTPDGMLSKALSCAVNGDWSKAGSLSEEVLKQNPSHVEALLLNALALSYQDRIQNAIDESLKAVQISPNLFTAQYLKGYLLYKNKNYDQCIEPLRAARAIRPNDLNTAILLAQASLMLKNTTAAAGYYKLIARDPRFNSNPASWTGLGMAFLKTNPNLSNSYFRIAEKKAPLNPATALNLAVLNDEYLRKKAVASEYYQKFLRLSQGKPEFDPQREQVRKRLSEIAAR